jgi:tripartite-type tricarboxylate transporter receptor subunit TctC
MLTLLSRVMMAASLLFALAPNASADDYPNRPVRLIIPFPPGGSNDVVGRLVAQQLSVKLGHQVYVDNRGGAGGTIGTEACANAAPDGYTICIISIAHAVNPALYTLKYDPIKSFTPISIFATGPNVLVVNPTSPIRSVKDLAQLRIGRRRQLPASGRRTVQTAGGRRHRPCALQMRRTGNAGRDRRPR